MALIYVIKFKMNFKCYYEIRLDPENIENIRRKNTSPFSNSMNWWDSLMSNIHIFNKYIHIKYQMKKYTMMKSNHPDAMRFDYICNLSLQDDIFNSVES